MKLKVTANRIKWGLNLYPPLWAAGVHVEYISQDMSKARIAYHVNRLTANALGVAYGGTMLTMSDPLPVLMGLGRLGNGYNAWDTAVEAKFVKQGRGTLHCVFELSDDVIDTVRRETANGEKYLHWFELPITDQSGDTVAIVRKQVYFRRKKNG